MSFTNAVGSLSKAAFRIEGGAVSGTGLQATTYPTTEATADAEEVLLKSSDLIPLISESISENRTFLVDNVITGSPGAASMDEVGIFVTGSLELAGFYDGLDAIIACAMGMEIGDASNSPAAQNSTALTCAGSGGGQTASNWKDSGTPFVSGDVGKIIRDEGGTGEGQVRRISAYVSTSEVTITPNWTVTPVEFANGKMAQEWKHLFELTRDLQDEDWDVVDSGYPTGGVGASGDQLVRRGTLGFLKANSIPQILRSVMMNSLTFTLTPKDGLKLSAEVMGFSRELASGTNTTGTHSAWDWDHASELFQENERIMFADTDHFRIDAFANDQLTSDDDYGISEFELVINNQLKGDDQTVISRLWGIQPARNAQREITGSFVIPRYATDQFITWLTAKTPLTAELSLSGSTIAAVARNITFYLPALQLTAVSAPIAGPGIVSQRISFRCLTPPSAITGVPTVNTVVAGELMIETLNQNAFSAFRDQNREY